MIFTALAASSNELWTASAHVASAGMFIVLHPFGSVLAPLLLLHPSARGGGARKRRRANTDARSDGP